MAFKLTKREAAQLDELVQAYEAAKHVLMERLDEIASNWEEALDERSEKWKESIPGQVARERVDMVRAWFDELPSDNDPAIQGRDLL